MKTAQFLVSALILVLLLAACAPAAAPAPAPQAPVPAPAAAPALAPVAAPAAPARAAWEEKWEKTLAEAKKEGKVVISATVAPEVRNALLQGLRVAYGIAVEVIVGRPAEINVKILAERRAGLYLWDHLITGPATPVRQLKPSGAIDPLEPALILPDVTDPQLIKKVWYRGDLWWADRDHTTLCTIMAPHPAIVAINTNLVKPGEIKSYKDFLDPKWKGRMISSDPTVEGTTFPSFMLYLFGPDYLRQLAKQELVITRDTRLQLEWLSQGKAPVALGPNSGLYREFKRMAAPIQGLTLAEGGYLTASSSAVTIFNRAPHPNAASVFINWLLSKEGQTALSKAGGGHSLREDVPTDHLAPEEIRQPGVKYWEKEREEEFFQKEKEFEIFKEIFGPLMKK